jgi:hypothetical protein
MIPSQPHVALARVSSHPYQLVRPSGTVVLQHYDVFTCGLNATRLTRDVVIAATFAISEC